MGFLCLQRKTILLEYKLSRPTVDRVVEELFAQKDAFLQFMMRFELGLEKPHRRQASQSAFRIGIAYFVGGAIPLAPYILGNDPATSLPWSIGATIVTLLAFGYFKGRLTGQRPWTSALKVTGIGAAAAVAAFTVARWIGQ